MTTQLGNTSTDVEKTRYPIAQTQPLWKHLHGRGEDIERRLCWIESQETPPRTWRRRTRLL